MGCREQGSIPSSRHFSETFNHPLDRRTVPGERLWELTISTPGRDVLDMDSLVALPFLTALRKEGQLEAIGCVSQYEQVSIYVRSPVYLSSFVAVSKVLGSIATPMGTQVPRFGAAGPPAPRDFQIQIQIDLLELSSHDLTLLDTLTAIQQACQTTDCTSSSLENYQINDKRSEKVALKELASIYPSYPAQRRWTWSLRLESSTLDELDLQLNAYEKAMGSSPTRIQRIPHREPLLKMELDQSAMKTQNIQPEEVYQLLGFGLGIPFSLPTRYPVVVTTQRVPLEKLPGLLQLRNHLGQLVSLDHLGWFQLTYLPAKVIRLSPETFAGYLLIAGSSRQQIQTAIQSAPIFQTESLVLHGISELSDGERAILGWPRLDGLNR